MQGTWSSCATAWHRPEPDRVVNRSRSLRSVSPELQLQPQKRRDGRRSPSLCFGFAACTALADELKRLSFPSKKTTGGHSFDLQKRQAGLASGKTRHGSPCRRSKASALCTLRRLPHQTTPSPPCDACHYGRAVSVSLRKGGPVSFLCFARRLKTLDPQHPPPFATTTAPKSKNRSNHHVVVTLNSHDLSLSLFSRSNTTETREGFCAV
jgi:hypothetical protein